MNCVILANGQIKNYSFFTSLFNNGVKVFCADGGVKHARQLGVIPDFIIGDMDSAEPELLSSLESAGTKILRFPAEKDELDTELALDEAIKYGATTITLLGGTGGRLDHTLAAIHLLLKPARLGIKVSILADDHFITLVTPENPLLFPGHTGTTVSLLPLTSEVKGVTSTGVKWPLTDAVLEVGKPYAVSNTVTSGEVRVSVEEGVLLFFSIF